MTENYKRKYEEINFILEKYQDEIVPKYREMLDRTKEELEQYKALGLEPEEIDQILDAYGRGQTLRTETAERLKIIKGISTDRLREIARAEEQVCATTGIKCSVCQPGPCDHRMGWGGVDEV